MQPTSEDFEGNKKTSKDGQERMSYLGWLSPILSLPLQTPICFPFCFLFFREKELRSDAFLFLLWSYASGNPWRHGGGGCDHRFVPDRGRFRFIILEN